MATCNVTSLIPEKSFTWVSGGPGGLVATQHEIAVDGDACNVTLRLQFTGLLSGIFARLTANINERYMAMEAEGLRKRRESP